MAATWNSAASRLGCTLILGLAVWVAGCTSNRSSLRVSTAPRVFVVAPVLNLSGSEDFDPMRLTDLIASEFLSFDDVAVVPVNLTLAELERQGKQAVETPDDAVELARALGADATIVTAITEYDPYDPPVLGMIMQWYAVNGDKPVATQVDPVAASRGTSEIGYALWDDAPLRPRWQLQRVFNAASEDLCDEIEDFAEEREGDGSPYTWRKYTRSQELYVRYCGWSLIRTMLLLDENVCTVATPYEAKE